MKAPNTSGIHYFWPIGRACIVYALTGYAVYFAARFTPVQPAWVTVVQAVNAGAYLYAAATATTYIPLIAIDPVVGAALIVAAALFDSLLSDDPEPPPSGTLTWSVANGRLVPHIVGANGGDGLLVTQAAKIQAELARFQYSAQQWRAVA